MADRIIYRGLVFAAVNAPPVPVPRKTAVQFYSRLTERLCPAASFQYVPPGEGEREGQLSFKVTVKEAEGRRFCNVTIDTLQGGLRLLVDQGFPPTFTDGVERVNEIASAYRDVVSQSEPQLMEARIRAQVATNTASARDFIAGHLLKERATWLARLGSVSHFGLHYDIEPSGDAQGPLEAPARKVVAEPLKEDPTSIYLEVMSNWGRVRTRPAGDKIEVVPTGPLSHGVETPSKYFEEVASYVREVLCPFLEGRQ
ncbi:MAG: hypothetical protein ACYTKD_00730 [Planctomycetota bacterium]